LKKPAFRSKRTVVRPSSSDLRKVLDERLDGKAFVPPGGNGQELQDRKGFRNSPIFTKPISGNGCPGTPRGSFGIVKDRISASMSEKLSLWRTLDVRIGEREFPRDRESISFFII